MKNWLRLLSIALVLFLLTAACSDGGAPRSAEPGAGTTHWLAPRDARPSPSPAPAALRMATMRAQQTAAGHEFVLGETGALESRTGTFAAEAQVRATGLGVRLSTASSTPSGGIDLGVVTTSVGRDDAAGSLRVLEQRAEGQELVLSRDGGVEERYLAGPLGLEQSYRIAGRPAGSGPLRIEVAFAGLTPSLDAGVDRVLLRDVAGHVKGGYRDLVAVDAAGQELSAHMEVQSASVSLVIDDAAARYPVSVDPLVWTLQTELSATTHGATDGAAGDFFGYSVAISGTLAVVGAPNHHAGAGAAYVWSQSGTSWSLQQELSAGDLAAGDSFGSSVAVSGGVVVVGAPYHTPAGGKTESGAAYVFLQSGTAWSQVTPELTASDAAASDGFGTSVSVSGATAIIGAPFHEANGHSQEGAAYVFAGSGTSWSQQTELTQTSTDGKVADLFGFSVSVSGSIAIVGAYHHDVGALVSAGAAYLWGQSGSSWTLQSEITAGDAAIADFFGYSVSVSGTTAIVGAYQHNSAGGTSSGAAYTFVQGAGNAWSEQAELSASDGAANDSFGYSVAITGGTAIVGAYSHAANGAAYTFTETGGVWTQQSPDLLASDGAANDFFGTSVAADGDVVIVGANQHLASGLSEAGAAYVYGGSVTGTANCYIDGTLYAAGAQNPSNACEVCTPTTSTSAWSNESNGTGCGAGLICNAGACVPGCYISGAFEASGTVNPANACQVCTPATSTSAWSSVTNGTACNDGNACDSNDTCQSGVCTAGSTTTCTPSDQCHAAGTCNPATGACSNPTAPNGTACNDGNACDSNDTCQAGVCAAGSTTTCTPSDACHVAGACNPATGACSNPTAPNGTACNDGNACDSNDTCQAGACTAGHTVTCTPSDACHVAGTCNPATGACSNPTAPNGTACNDGNACDSNDACQSGVCTAGSTVTCTASDACHVAGTCNPATGTCSNPAAPNGTACNDGNACDSNDTCQSGTCTAGSTVTCTASDPCHLAGTCNSSSGVCSSPTAPDGTPCSGGSCEAGTCVLSASDAGSDSSASDAGNDSGAADGGTDSGAADGGIDSGTSDGGRESGAADGGTDSGAAQDSGSTPGQDSGSSTGQDSGTDSGSADSGSNQSDSGANEDGSADAEADSGTGASGGGGGCGCRVVQSQDVSQSRMAGLGVILGLAVLRLKRRRKMSAAPVR